MGINRLHIYITSPQRNKKDKERKPTKKFKGSDYFFLEKGICMHIDNIIIYSTYIIKKQNKVFYINAKVYTPRTYILNFF